MLIRNAFCMLQENTMFPVILRTWTPRCAILRISSTNRLEQVALRYTDKAVLFWHKDLKTNQVSTGRELVKLTIGYFGGKSHSY